MPRALHPRSARPRPLAYIHRSTRHPVNLSLCSVEPPGCNPTAPVPDTYALPFCPIAGQSAPAAAATSGPLTLMAWLSDLGLPHYAPAFQSAGFANLPALSSLTDADLDAVAAKLGGGRLPGRARKKLLAASALLARRRHELYAQVRRVMCLAFSFLSIEYAWPAWALDGRCKPREA